MVTIKRNSEYRRIYGHGKSAANVYMAAYVMENGLGFDRYGFSVSRKVGKAVERNKVKRRLKEMVRVIEKARDTETVNEQTPPGVGPSGLDWVIVARGRAAAAQYSELNAGFRALRERLLKKSGRQPYTDKGNSR